MNLEYLKNKQVAVLGYGTEGKAVTKYLLKHGIKPVLFDETPWNQWDISEQEAIKKLNINFIFGNDAFKELYAIDVAFRSPGIQKSKILKHNSKIELTSQTKFFFEHCPAKIIGVTGTKGKGTTCSLIYEILNQNTIVNNLKSTNYLTGNIGQIQPLDFFDDLNSNDTIIFELSSFQLQDLTISPNIAVVLMVTEEHLDYHSSAEEYIEAKASIVKYQSSTDIVIYNSDFPNSESIAKKSPGKKFSYSRLTENTDCFINNNTLKIPSDKLQIPLDNIKLKGKHNLENICAAVLTCQTLKVNKAIIQSVINNFYGLEHRLEFVAEVNNIKFYNDSFSTTPETAIAAIESFKEPEILILGGSSKNSNFTNLAETINKSNNIKSIIIIGQEAENIKNLIKRNDILIQVGASSMRDIFKQVKSVVETGDIVLLSPACASFGMFKNYKDRGNQFKQEVSQWH